MFDRVDHIIKILVILTDGNDAVQIKLCGTRQGNRHPIGRIPPEILGRPRVVGKVYTVSTSV